MRSTDDCSPVWCPGMGEGSAQRKPSAPVCLCVSPIGGKSRKKKIKEAQRSLEDTVEVGAPHPPGHTSHTGPNPCCPLCLRDPCLLRHLTVPARHLPGHEGHEKAILSKMQCSSLQRPAPSMHLKYPQCLKKERRGGDLLLHPLRGPSEQVR